LVVAIGNQTTVEVSMKKVVKFVSSNVDTCSQNCEVVSCEMIMTIKRKTTSNAVEILHRRYYEGKLGRIARLEEQRANDEIARKIFAVRTGAGLSQRKLAELVGTTPSVISRLEDSDYEGHSLTMLKRIAAAVNKRVEIRFVPLRVKLQAAIGS
jgi:DNA-binding XRE family transcriptional regulator